VCEVDFAGTGSIQVFISKTWNCDFWVGKKLLEMRNHYIYYLLF